MSKVPNKVEYSRRMDQIRRAHRCFNEKWEAARRKTGKAGAAYDAAKTEQQALYKLLESFFHDYLEPLFVSFERGEHEAIDSVIDFLEVDIPTFRCGYAKEGFYRKLKKAPLEQSQIARLQELAVARCASTEYRREDGELRRLMIRLADKHFLEKIAGLANGADAQVRRKCALTFSVVLGGRKDLRSTHWKRA